MIFAPGDRHLLSVSKMASQTSSVATTWISLWHFQACTQPRRAPIEVAHSVRPFTWSNSRSAEEILMKSDRRRPARVSSRTSSVTCRCLSKRNMFETHVTEKYETHVLCQTHLLHESYSFEGAVYSGLNALIGGRDVRYCRMSVKSKCPYTSQARATDAADSNFSIRTFVLRSSLSFFFQFFVYGVFNWNNI